MRTIEGLFKEFLSLSYVMNQEIVNNHTGDIYIENLVILRQTRISWDFIVLSTGDLISIPYVIIDLFKSFDVYHKGVVFNLVPQDDTESFIKFMLSFVHSLVERKFDNTIDDLGTLKRYGLKDFITFLSNILKVRISIPGLMYSSKNTLTKYI